MPEALTLQSLPLFPLQTVLFPDGTLQLQIFEVRYLDLIGKCHKTGAPFGVVSLLQGEEVRKPDTSVPTGGAFAVERFVDIGTLAKIVEWSAPQSGLMVVRCTGGTRFRINQRNQLKHGLWLADVTTISADAALPIPPDLQSAANALGAVLSGLQARATPPAAIPIAEPFKLDDCAWVANRWLELLTLPPNIKQGLMQLENPLLRLELVVDMLSRNGIATDP